MSTLETREISGLCYPASDSCGHVLVLSGCPNKIPQTGWLINNRNLFLTVMEAGKSKVRALAESMFGEGQLPDS